ncbi:hypothetical protein KKB55_03700 [Myxococcota bacterium]|nr:hypothetical protein [Myxococcota bacterium]MBU1896858.1 hypothetical protein [Myxococcota bacterium]
MLTLTLLLAACAGVAEYADPRIDEPSGLVASRRHAGVYWTHNDSGDGPRLFAVTAEGRLLRVYDVIGAAAEDWEDIALDDAGQLYIGDIGNNKNRRRDLTVYIASEPDPGPLTPAAPPGPPRPLPIKRAVRFSYPDQAEFPPKARNFDAEALFWARDHLYLLTKHRGDQRTNLYRFEDLSGAAPIQPRKIGDGFFLGGDPARFGGMVTAADATPSGDHLAVLSYHALFIFPRPAQGDDYLSMPPRRVPLDQDKTIQAEAVAWAADGALYFTNEQRCIFRLEGLLTPHVEQTQDPPR